VGKERVELHLCAFMADYRVTLNLEKVRQETNVIYPDPAKSNKIVKTVK
jgi:hypothetical protein